MNHALFGTFSSLNVNTSNSQTPRQSRGGVWGAVCRFLAPAPHIQTNAPRIQTKTASMDSGFGFGVD